MTCPPVLIPTHIDIDTWRHKKSYLGGSLEMFTGDVVGHYRIDARYALLARPISFIFPSHSYIVAFHDRNDVIPENQKVRDRFDPEHPMFGNVSIALGNASQAYDRCDWRETLLADIARQFITQFQEHTGLTQVRTLDIYYTQNFITCPLGLANSTSIAPMIMDPGHMDKSAHDRFNLDASAQELSTLMMGMRHDQNRFHRAA